MSSRQPRPRLIEQRVNQGLSCREAARRIGISHDTLERLERGGGHVASLKRAADFYGLPVSELAPDLLDPEPVAA